MGEKTPDQSSTQSSPSTPVTPQPVSSPLPQNIYPSPRHFPKKAIFTITLLFILLLITGTTWAFKDQIFQQNQTPASITVTPPQTTTTPTDPTADWKTYRDEAYGFEFKYPSLFSVSSEPYKYALSDSKTSVLQSEHYKSGNLNYFAVHIHTLEKYRFYDVASGEYATYDTIAQDWFLPNPRMEMRGLNKSTNSSFPIFSSGGSFFDGQYHDEAPIEGFIATRSVDRDTRLIIHPSEKYLIEIVRIKLEPIPVTLSEAKKTIFDFDQILSTFKFTNTSTDGSMKTIESKELSLSFSYPISWTHTKNKVEAKVTALPNEFVYDINGCSFYIGAVQGSGGPSPIVTNKPTTVDGHAFTMRSWYRTDTSQIPFFMYIFSDDQDLEPSQRSIHVQIPEANASEACLAQITAILESINFN